MAASSASCPRSVYQLGRRLDLFEGSAAARAVILLNPRGRYYCGASVLSLPLVAGRAEAWAFFSCRAVLPTRTSRSGCGRRRGVLQRWSVGTSPTFLCWTQRPFRKNLFWQLLSSTLIKRQPKKHLRDAAVFIQALRTVSQPSAPQCARETARAAARALTSGELGKTQFGPQKAAAPPRRCSIPARRRKAAQVRAARPKYRAPAAPK